MVNVDKLRILIGREVDFEGQRCQIIEILEDDPALVLQSMDYGVTIQADQHGEAHRKVPPTITVSILNQDGEGLNPAFSAMRLGRFLNSVNKP